MLILERKADESILIGEEIVIRVLDVGRGSARIGIEAPSHVNVLREELEPRYRQQAPAKEIKTAEVKEKSRDKKVLITYLRPKRTIPK